MIEWNLEQNVPGKEKDFVQNLLINDDVNNVKREEEEEGEGEEEGEEIRKKLVLLS